MTTGKIIHDVFVSVGDAPELPPAATENWEARRILAAALRRLNTAVLTSDVPTDDLRKITAALSREADNIESLPRVFGRQAMRERSSPDVMHDMSAIAGLSNAAAIPITIWREGDRMHGKLITDWSQEGPNGHVHGGVIAGVFDHFLGLSQHGFDTGAGGTARLAIQYHHLTPLNTPLRLIAELKNIAGRKKTIAAELWCGDTCTASCEGLFISSKSPL